MIRFLPDEYYSSTYKIDFKKYYDMGYRGIPVSYTHLTLPTNSRV